MIDPQEYPFKFWGGLIGVIWFLGGAWLMPVLLPKLMLRKSKDPEKVKAVITVYRIAGLFFAICCICMALANIPAEYLRQIGM